MDDAREKRVKSMISGKVKVNKFELIDDLSFCWDIWIYEIEL